MARGASSVQVQCTVKGLFDPSLDLIIALAFKALPYSYTSRSPYRCPRKGHVTQALALTLSATPTLQDGARFYVKVFLYGLLLFSGISIFFLTSAAALYVQGQEHSAGLRHVVAARARARGYAVGVMVMHSAGLGHVVADTGIALCALESGPLHSRGNPHTSFCHGASLQGLPWHDTYRSYARLMQ